MNRNEQITPQPGSYETGSTRPPKRNRGILAVLLALVIFLGGIASILRFMNVRLFQQLSPDRVAVRFYAAPEQQEASVINISALGVRAEAISEPYRRYYRLPAGLFLSYVGKDTPAHTAGLRQGDILLSVNGKRVTNLNTLQTLLESTDTKAPLLVIFCREGVHYSATVLLRGDGD